MATINNWNNTVPSAAVSFNTGLAITSGGIMTNTKQPAFFAYSNTSPTNVTGDGTLYTLAMDTELFDTSASFNTGTFTFTAPVTGVYSLSLYLTFSPGNSDSVTDLAFINANGVSYQCLRGGPSFYQYPVTSSITYGMGNSIIVPLSATQTVLFQFQCTGGTKTVDVIGGQTNTYCSGFLLC